MDELINFEPDPDHSPDAGTGLLSPISYRLRNFAALPIGCQRAVLLRGILHRENPTYTSWRRAARASRSFKMVLFTDPSEDLCRRYMRSTDCLSSYLLIWFSQLSDLTT